jgi:hypothetical protein
MLAAVIAEGVAIALLAVLVLGLLRSHALILKALHELGAGLELEKDAAPVRDSASPGPVHVDLESGVVPNARPTSSRAADIVGTTLDGRERTIMVSGSGQRTLLAFLTSGCSVCQTFWEEFRGSVDVPGQSRLAVVAKGPEEESITTLRQLAGDSIEVVQSSAGWTDYGIPGSPYFVFVEDGVITGEGSSTTWPQVRDLMTQAVSDSAEARAAAGRTGPGLVGDDLVDRGERDSLPRMDRELLASGIHPGHSSLFESPEPAPGGGPHGHEHDHSHSHDHGHAHPHEPAPSHSHRAP